jgi:hypothetical protein
MALVSYQEKNSPVIDKNIMHNKISSEFGFSDSELVSYQRTGDEFTVTVKAWNGSRLTVFFKQFEGVLDYGLGDISDFVEESDETPFIKQVISRIFTETPKEHTYRVYQFLDLDGEPILEVVAASANVSF